MAKIKALVEIVTAKDGKSTTFAAGKEHSATAAQLEGLVKDVHYVELTESKDLAPAGKGGKGGEGGKEDEV
jgi:hypothetical protein